VKVGDPRDAGVLVGPLVDKAAFDGMEKALAEAKAAGFLNRVVPETDLDGAVEELVQVLLHKPKLALLETKAHVNAVTESMVGTGRSWADADGLYAGLRDEEGGASATAYMERLRSKR
jgi:enoyl-CoA hydratase/carnithine racemase